MTIQKIDTNGRLLSAEHRDPKPDSAPGILLLETDTGIWWISQEDRTWKACYPTLAQHQVLMDRAAALELDVEAKAVTIATMQARITAMQTEVNTLKKAAPR